MLTKKKLKKELKKELKQEIEDLKKEIRDLQKYCGFSLYLSCTFARLTYSAPKVSTEQKVNLLLDHFGLDILVQAERIMLLERKKKRVRRKKKGKINV